MKGADACSQSCKFGWRKLANKTLFDHELREGRESSVILQAAVIGKTTVTYQVESDNQPVPAARTTQGGRMRLALVAAVRMDQLEQIDDSAGIDLDAFERVEPDTLAGEAKIKNYRSEISMRQLQPCHRLGAQWAGG